MRYRAHRFGELTAQVEWQAQERAAESARHVPWQVLLETRNQYLAWQEFYFWARSIMESEGTIPEWLAGKLKEMCPGFLASGKSKATRGAKDAELAAVRLGEWIDDQIFTFAESGGWLPAVTFYAVREPRYQRASTCWSESVKKWRTTKPRQYPSLDEWLLDAAACDESAYLLPEIRKQRECFKLVDSARLTDAVSRYIDWEAFAYWARPALDGDPPLPDKVKDELDARCAGFTCRRAVGAERFDTWKQFMAWIGDQFFQGAKTEGWYEAIVISARMHPRAIRTMEYANHCDERWEDRVPVPYPSFASWRKDADLYVAP